MKRLILFIKVYLFWTLLGFLSKPIFMLLHAGMFVDAAKADDSSILWNALCVMWHGLRLDLAVAGYFTIPFALLLIISVLVKGQRWFCVTWKVLMAVCVFLYVLAVQSNILLYGYWGFPLDTTPLFYLTTSPADAMASTPMWMNIMGWLMLGVATYIVYRCSPIRKLSLVNASIPLWDGLCVTLLSISLFLPIRGGFTVATNNTGSVYFSEDMLLNHAAVNPVFSFLESAFQQADYGEQYRFMDDDEARRLVSEMVRTELRPRSAVDSVYVNIPTAEQGGCNVVMVILESFSSYIMQEAGNEDGVVPNLDALSREGLYFPNFYANSFRTDRGLVSILSGFPSQPTMSLMKVASKTNNLSSLARSLRSHGYTTQYYYGGDANFTKMRSYLMQTGFESVVSEDDFPRSQRTGKWGVPDEYLFDKALNDILSSHSSSSAESAEQGRGVSFCVIQTSSSHEPFEVPYEASFPYPALTAFAYVDHCLGDFINRLKQSPQWQNTLVVLVPDHLGGYPPCYNYDTERYHIPLIFTGGVVCQPQRIPTIGSQIDISATVLSLLGYKHDDFTYSKDLFDPEAPHFAYFSFPDMMGLITSTDTVVYDNSQQRFIKYAVQQKQQNAYPQNEGELGNSVKAYLQTIYDNIDQMGK